MAPSDRLYRPTTFYQSAIVTITPSFFFIFEIFELSEYRYLEIYVRSHSPCEFMHHIYIAEIYRAGATVCCW